MFLEQYIPQNPFFALTLAAVLGAIIGIERDIRGRASGLRTNMVVSLGSALFTIISIFTVERFGPNGDVSRIAAQVVSGIGFLGAGVIIKSGLTIKGLTSAASLWLVAAIGMASGFYYYTYALFTTILGLVALGLLDYVEKSYKKDFYRQLSVLSDTPIDLDAVTELLNAKGCRIQFANYTMTEQGGVKALFYIKVRVRNEYLDQGYRICKEVQSLLPSAREVKWEKR